MRVEFIGNRNPPVGHQWRVAWFQVGRCDSCWVLFKQSFMRNRRYTQGFKAGPFRKYCDRCGK